MCVERVVVTRGSCVVLDEEVRLLEHPATNTHKASVLLKGDMEGEATEASVAAFVSDEGKACLR